MNKYVGVDCPVCGKKFASEDDVVVCPVCGAPHHRSCYKENGGCALESRHAQGQEWQAPQPEAAQSPQGEHQAPRTVTCPSCGAANPPEGIFCQVCGTRIAPPQQSAPGWQQQGPQNQGGPQSPYGQQQAYGQQQGNPYGQQQAYGQQQGNPYGQQQAYGQQQQYGYYNPFGGMNPNEKIGDIAAKELATFVGPSAPYYLSRFHMLSQNPRALTWNWSAFFFNFLYFFYRKMYALGAVLLVIFAITMVPSFLFAFEYFKELMAQGVAINFPLPEITTPYMESLVSIQAFLRAIWFGVMASMGFIANKLYYKATVNTIGVIRQDERSQDVGSYIQMLTFRGGVSRTSVLAILAALMIAYFTISYLIGLVVVV